MENHFIARINGTDIVTVEVDGQTFVPIKPICDALGISYTGQLEKIKSDPTYSEPTIRLSRTVAADGKEREMACLSHMMVYLWLGSINPGNVSDKARNTVIEYRTECARVLFEHFTASMTRTVETNNAEIALLRQINEALSTEKEAKAQRAKLEQKLKHLRSERLNAQPQLF